MCGQVSLTAGWFPFEPSWCQLRSVGIQTSWSAEKKTSTNTIQVLRGNSYYQRPTLSVDWLLCCWSLIYCIEASGAHECIVTRELGTKTTRTLSITWEMLLIACGVSLTLLISSFCFLMFPTISNILRVYADLLTSLLMRSNSTTWDQQDRVLTTTFNYQSYH